MTYHVHKLLHAYASNRTHTSQKQIQDNGVTTVYKFHSAT